MYTYKIFKQISLFFFFLTLHKYRVTRVIDSIVRPIDIFFSMIRIKKIYLI